jgi:hypothetical protein
MRSITVLITPENPEWYIGDACVGGAAPLQNRVSISGFGLQYGLNFD